MGLMRLFTLLVCAAVTSAAELAQFSPSELQKLIALADATLQAADAQKQELKAPDEPFELTTLTQLKAHFSELPGHISSREQRGWKVVRQVARELLDAPADAPKHKALAEVLH